FGTAALTAIVARTLEETTGTRRSRQTGLGTNRYAASSSLKAGRFCVSGNTKSRMIPGDAFESCLINSPKEPYAECANRTLFFRFRGDGLAWSGVIQQFRSRKNWDFLPWNLGNLKTSRWPGRM